MKAFTKVAILAAAITPSAQAQMPAWSSEQTALWEYVAHSWDDDVVETGAWPADYVHEKGATWRPGMIAPWGRADWIRRSEFDRKHSETLVYTLSPQAISIVGDTAVVHYSIDMVDADTNGKQHRTALALVETLVHEDGRWQFLASAEMDLTRRD